MLARAQPSKPSVCVLDSSLYFLTQGTAVLFYVDQSAKGYGPTAKGSTMLLEVRLGSERVLNVDLVGDNRFAPELRI